MNSFIPRLQRRQYTLITQFVHTYDAFCICCVLTAVFSIDLQYCFHDRDHDKIKSYVVVSLPTYRSLTGRLTLPILAFGDQGSLTTRPM